MALFRGIGARRDATRGTSPIEARKSLAGLFSATGVLPGAPTPLLTGNAAWTYTVAGPAWFVASRGPSDGTMLYGNDGATIIGATGVGSTVPIAPGAGLSRIDIAWTRHPTNGENADTSSEPLFGVESGVAASSSPVAPTLPAGAIELGRNTMTSAATSTVSAGNTITQSAQVATLRGAPHIVNTSAERDAYGTLVGLSEGLRVYRLDTHVVETYNGTIWSGQPTRDRGSVVNATTGATGNIIVGHALGVTPTIILTNINGLASAAEKTIRVSARTSTNFTVLCFYNGSGAGASNPGWSFDWVVEA